MRSLVLKNKGLLEIIEKDVPELEEFEALVEVKATCLCGSDLKLIGQSKIKNMTLGHEFSGVVVKLGTKVPIEFLSSKVTAFPMITCLVCSSCVEGRHRDCENKKSIGWDIDGCFSTHIKMDYRFLIRLSEDIGFEEAALIEHLCCGYRVAKEIEGFSLNKTSKISILGDGPIALANIIFLKKSGYENLTLIGKHEDRIEMASKLGAKEVISFKDKTSWPIDSDAIVLSTYTDDSMVTLFSNSNLKLIIPQTRIQSKEILQVVENRSIRLGRGFAYLIEDFDEVAKLIEKNEIPTKLMITQEITIEEFKEMINLKKFKKSTYKTFIKPNLEKSNLPL